MSGAAPECAAGVAILIALLPFLVMGVQIMAHAGQPMQLSGSFALTELATQEAAVGRRLTGPWGRFGWNHPGPALFYALAPIYRLSNSSPLGLYLGAVVLNGLFIGAAVLAGARLAGAVGAYATASVVLTITLSLSPSTLAHFWNPYVLTIPLFLFGMLCALIAIEGGGWVVWALIVGTFAVQSHVGGGPLVVGLPVFAVLYRGFTHGRQTPRPAAKSTALTRSMWHVGWVLLVLLWAPVAIEQLMYGERGNIAELMDFFSGEHHGHSLLGATYAFIFGATVLPLGASSATDLPPGLTFDRLLVLLFSAYAVSVSVRKHSQPHEGSRVLALLAVVGSSICVVALTRVQGPHYGYLVYWMAAILAYVWLAVLSTTFQTLQLPRWRAIVGDAGSRLPSLVACVLALMATVSALNDRAVSRDHDPDVQELLATLLSSAEEHGGEGPVVVDAASYGNGEWEHAAGLVVELTALGYEVAVSDRWVERYSPAFQHTGTPTMTLLVGHVGVEPLEERVAGSRFVGRSAEATLWIKYEDT